MSDWALTKLGLDVETVKPGSVTVVGSSKAESCDIDSAARRSTRTGLVDLEDVRCLYQFASPEGFAEASDLRLKAVLARHESKKHLFFFVSYFKRLVSIYQNKHGSGVPGNAESECVIDSQYDKDIRNERRVTFPVDGKDVPPNSKGGSGKRMFSSSNVEDNIYDNQGQIQDLQEYVRYKKAVVPELLSSSDVIPFSDVNNRRVHFVPEFVADSSRGSLWSEGDKAAYEDLFKRHQKDFHKISQGIGGKSIADCITFYYLNRADIQRHHKKAKSVVPKKGLVHSKPHKAMMGRVLSAPEPKKKKVDESADIVPPRAEPPKPLISQPIKNGGVAPALAPVVVASPVHSAANIPSAVPVNLTAPSSSHSSKDSHTENSSLVFTLPPPPLQPLSAAFTGKDDLLNGLHKIPGDIETSHHPHPLSSAYSQKEMEVAKILLGMKGLLADTGT